MSKDKGKPRFIRKNGKIIPIGGKKKGGDNRSKGKPKNKIQEAAFRKEGSKALKRSAKKDQAVAKTGRKVATASFAVSALAGITAIATKGKRGALTAGIAGVLGITNAGFATGRESAAKIKNRGAKTLLGKKVKGKGPAPIGAAATRAHKTVSAIENKSQQIGKVGFKKAFAKKQRNTGF